MGIINKKRHVHLDWKEDYELSIDSYIRDGGVIRFNHIAVKHNLYTKKGGIGLDQKERMGEYIKASEWLINKYPHLVKWNPRREGEVLLVKNANRFVRQFNIDKSIFEKLEGLLQKYKIPWKSVAGYDSKGRTTNGRRGFPKHRACCYGLIKYKCGGKIDLSYNTKKHPDIYEELVKVGKLICPFEFTSIMVNHNVVCPKHIDTNNVGDSMLVSLGEYEGCNIVIDGKEYDARYSPVVFNGSKLVHSNTLLISGNKYSLVFFSIKMNHV